jgi:branched-chain amino acid transport system permease protein
MKTDQLTIERSNRSSRIGLFFLVILIVALALAPYWASRAELRLFAEIYMYLALASLWNLLTGYSGLPSIGQQAYVGVGAYILFGFAILAGIPPLWTIPLAGILAAALAVPVALLLFRLRGAYFAIGTWVVAEVFRLVASQVSSLGGGSGTSLPIDIITSLASGREAREFLLYWLALTMIVFVMAVIVFLLRSRYGLALTAIRDNQLAARSNGVNVARVKLLIYVVVAACTAMLGALIFLTKLRISPDTAFSVHEWTAFIIFIVVIGGIGRIEGPIIGTIIFFLLREAFADLGTIYQMLLGLVAIVVMLKAPQGVWGMIADRYGIQLFPLARTVSPTERHASIAKEKRG